jgi:hypothetical protein
MHRLLSTILVLLIAAAVPAWGEDDHDHDHSAKHGGIVVESGHHHLEVIAKDGSLDVLVQDEDGKPEDVSAAKATAVVLSEGKKFDIALAPNNGTTLKGTAPFKAVKGTTIVITLTMPEHAPEQVRVKLD